MQNPTFIYALLREFCRQSFGDVSRAFLVVLVVFASWFESGFAPLFAQGENRAASLAARVRGLNPAKSLEQYVLDKWQMENGFQQTGVRAMLQTRDGYLWIGAAEGLARFDGARFVVFDKSNMPLKKNGVLSLVEDRAGALWIGTEDGLLCVREGAFTMYGVKEGLPDYRINALCEDAQGNLWIGTDMGATIRRADGRMTTYTTANGLTNNTVLSFASDKQGGVWIGTSGGGVNHWAAGRIEAFVTIEGQFRPYAPEDGLVGDGVYAMIADGEGRLWLGTSEGLLKIERYAATAFYAASSGLANPDVRALALDREGSLWIGTNGGGVARLTSAGQISSFTSRQGLPSDEIFALLEDREGSVWMGSDAGGIARFKDKRFSSYTAKDGLSHNNISAIIEGGDGSVYFGTNGGLNVFSAGSWSNITTQRGLAGNAVTSLWADRAGAIWVGSNAGLQKMKNGVFTARYDKSDGLPGNRVSVIYEDRAGALWIGTDDGAAKLTFSGGTSASVQTYTTKNGLGANGIYAILEDAQGTVWLGGRGGGLASLKNGSVAKYMIRDGLPSNYVWSLYEDRAGALWIGTGGGLALMKNGKFSTLTTRQGLFSDVIFSLQEDDAGWMWMSCNKGVFRVKKSDLLSAMQNKTRVSCIPYGVADGMKSVECNGGSQPAVWKSRDGRFWYPTIKGAALVEPLTIPYNPLPPTVVLERVIADGKFLRLPGVSAFQYAEASTKDSFTAANQEAESGAAKGLASAPELQPGVEKFEFQYSATSLLMPERVKFKYMLEGFDDDWVDAGSRRVAFYTNLPRGREYRFRVIACNNDGVWNEAGVSTAFYLKPYFYETPWFIGLCVVAALGVGFGFYRFRLRQVQKRNEELERIVQERTEEVRRQAKEIERANGELKEKNERLSVVSKIGRELTSSLTMETIVTTVYQRLYEVMDATIFGVGLYRPWKETIEYNMSIDKGIRLPFYERDMNDKNQFPVWCIENAKEIFILDVDKEATKYIPDFRKTINPLQGLTPEIDEDYAKSLIFMPLSVRGEAIGALSVQSYKRHAYTQNHLEIVRTLASYVAIAISNAEQFEELQRKQRIITEFNKHITDSINYAKRIQTAMLPTEDLIGRSLSDYFILFKPRDVVSGDFYWYCDKGEQIYIAAVDCTGHGVPGAFMSLIGNSLLNEAVNAHGAPAPGTLLSELHKGVQRSLRQTETNNRDGMDITLCMIDKERRVVEYAGAMNSLYVMKNQELMELKADKKPIGGTETDERIFMNHTIDLSDTPPGQTMLYLTSDGFKDQFGGEKGKKFSSKRFVETLRQIYMLPAAEQRQKLDEIMTEWMGTKHKQIDDMLVIGVRI
jgi:ligand-binding sensor domain-containing protein/serine phosphatase RsbU (regulator of sigma subunit)